MRDLIEEYLPNAPKLGLFVTPNLPGPRVRNALRDYATSVSANEVVALYDATLMGSGKDGAVFLVDRFVYQNTDLEPPQTLKYDDIVRVTTKRRLLGGKQILLDVNSGTATVTHTLDFSGHPEAADYVARFLHEAMLRTAPPDREPSRHRTAAGSDVDAVYRELTALKESGVLAEADFQRLVETLLDA